ncbi:unnamed protein product [Protopolystoma xenopodis]|uniref:Uncharacterized protein n=1 Tax=Protopolystoma xenopodis TaxID=117903 RepID=A0A448WG15_9PLAT|nr:unnamed protein product [Protopolystoma xenopodis]
MLMLFGHEHSPSPGALLCWPCRPIKVGQTANPLRVRSETELVAKSRLSVSIGAHFFAHPQSNCRQFMGINEGQLALWSGQPRRRVVLTCHSLSRDWGLSETESKPVGTSVQEDDWPVEIALSRPQTLVS